MESIIYTYSYSSSRWSGYMVLLIALIIIIVMASSFASQTAQLEAVLFLLAIVGLFAWLGLKTVLRNQPELQFGPSGIWTPKLGDTKWQQVTLVFGHVTSGKAGTFYTLKILDRVTHRQLDWVALGVTNSESEIIKAELERIKKADFK